VLRSTALNFARPWSSMPLHLPIGLDARGFVTTKIVSTRSKASYFDVLRTTSATLPAL